MDDNQLVEKNNQAGSRNREPASKMTSFTKGLLCGLAIALFALAAGVMLAKVVKARMLDVSNEQFKTEEELGVVNAETNRKMMAIEEIIKSVYLEEVDPKVLEDGIYSGMVKSLEDPYSDYYSAEELKELQQNVEGIYSGIGAYVAMDSESGLPVISGVIEDTPSEEADLRQGDLIYKVDEKRIQGMTTGEVVKLIRGEEGTKVHLTLIREGEKDYLEVDVERRKVETPTVNYEKLENQIAYIQIIEFDKVTVDQFADALAVCKGSDMKALVLDLRSNPGGSLDSVCEIARMILPEGLIVYTEDKYGEREEFTCDGERELKIPMVVLVNNYSASASEILTGAIKDYGVGTIMGTTTFGKGVVQRPVGLKDGSAVKLTVSKYFTPKGNDIHGVGIKPDIEVEFDGEAYYKDGIDKQLDTAVKYLTENYHLDEK